MPMQQLFLKEFTTELILNSLPAKESEELEKIRKEELVDKKQEIQKPREMLQRSMLRKEDTGHFQHFHPQGHIKQLKLPKPFEHKRLERPKPEIKKEISGGNPKEPIDASLGKIEPLLNNPEIFSIECPGPEKFIIIKRGNLRTPIKLILGKDEIESILNYFSQQTNIPRVGGVFKAILNNVIITAIASEFAGPRFIITKTNPRPSPYLEAP